MPPVRSDDDLDLLGRLTNRHTVMHSLPVIVLRRNTNAKGLRGDIRTVNEKFLPFNLEPLQERDEAALSHVCRRDCPSCNQYRYRGRDVVEAGHRCVPSCAACLEAILQKGRKYERMETLRKSHDLFSDISVQVYLPARQKVEKFSIVDVRPDE